MKRIVLLTALLTVAMAAASQPVITNQPASRALWVNGSVTFAVGMSGAGPFTYQWQLNTTNLPNNVITTVAGGGTNYPDDGSIATDAKLNGVMGVAVDTAGNLFIVETSSYRISKVNTNGIITRVAGNGLGNGYSGDGGMATNAELNEPEGVAVDTIGNLFIADSDNNRIRKVDTNGIITTVAGNGSQGFSGDGGAATNAYLQYPEGVTVDAFGNLFIADSNNNRIRKVNTNGIITTVAGGAPGYTPSGDGGAATNAGLYVPKGVAVDATGNLFIADSGDNLIRKVDTNGIITTVAGNGRVGYQGGDGGAATNAGVPDPWSVAVDASGNLFIVNADYYGNVRKVDTNGIITTVVGNYSSGFSGDGGPATNAALTAPSCVVFDVFGNLFIADAGNFRIRKVTDTQGPALGLNDVTGANAGSYQVVVTGPGGSITSSVASLIVTASPLIYQTVLNSAGSVALDLVSQPGSTNVVLCATNLAPPVFWQPLSTNMAGADGDWQFTDTDAVNYPMRFYRSQTR